MTPLSQSDGMPRLLDLFCGAGGAGMGYHRAGFEVVGVDVHPQPRYPFEFHQADALEWLDEGGAVGFDAIHASPPCQAYSSLRALTPRDHPELVEPIRERLRASGLPYIIENVVGAPLLGAVTLCGSSFGLPLRRHRLFESNCPLLVPSCAHEQLPAIWHVPLGDPRRNKQPSRFVGVYGSTRYRGEDANRRQAMGIEWMNRKELTQAIPPAYTELLGHQLMAAVDRREAVAA